MPWQIRTIMWNSHLYVVNFESMENSFVLILELVVAECFCVSRNLFPDFGYDKIKCVFAIIWGIPGTYCVSEYQTP